MLLGVSSQGPTVRLRFGDMTQREYSYHGIAAITSEERELAESC